MPNPSANSAAVPKARPTRACPSRARTSAARSAPRHGAPARRDRGGGRDRGARTRARRSTGADPVRDLLLQSDRVFVRAAWARRPRAGDEPRIRGPRREGRHALVPGVCGDLCGERLQLMLDVAHAPGPRSPTGGGDRARSRVSVVADTATTDRAWCDVQDGRIDEGVDALGAAFDAYVASGQRIGTSSYSLPVLEGYLAAGDVRRARSCWTGYRPSSPRPASASSSPRSTG